MRIRSCTRSAIHLILFDFGSQVRQTPALLAITRALYQRTWGCGARGFKVRNAPPSPQLLYYIDRTSLRLPLGAIAPILAEADRRRLVITISLPPHVVRANRAALGELNAEAAEQFADDSDVYIVDRLLSRRKSPNGRGVEYLVRWQGYGPDGDTWEPSAHILDADVIRKFEEDQLLTELADDGVHVARKRPRAGADDAAVRAVVGKLVRDVEKRAAKERAAADAAILSAVRTELRRLVRHVERSHGEGGRRRAKEAGGGAARDAAGAPPPTPTPLTPTPTPILTPHSMLTPPPMPTPPVLTPPSMAGAMDGALGWA